MQTSNQDDRHFSGCLICGKPLVYGEKSTTATCHLCGRPFETDTWCEDGHFICDQCHSAGTTDVFALLRTTTEKDPIRLFEQMMRQPGMYMHGPEHHITVPGVLLAVYHNNGGEINLDTALKSAAKRGGQVPGGACGF